MIWFSLFYLIFLPLVVFSDEPPLTLILSLCLGYLVFCLYKTPRFSFFIIFLITLTTAILVVHPRSGIDYGMLNAINAQRGEHADYVSSLLPKLIHNKIDLGQSFINNFDKLLSPVAIFASGFWHHLSPYYPLGFLFPWDLYFIYRYLSKEKYRKHQFSPFFLIALLLLLFLTGFVYIDQALIFGFAVIYFLAILAALGYASTSPKTRLVFLFINSVYLIYQLTVTSYFKI